MANNEVKVKLEMPLSSGTKALVAQALEHVLWDGFDVELFESEDTRRINERIIAEYGDPEADDGEKVAERIIGALTELALIYGEVERDAGTDSND